MRIRTNIFIWVFFATVVPLTILTLAATYYSEFNRQEKIQHEVTANLNSTAASIKRELKTQKNILLGISHAPAVQTYTTVLAGIINDDLPADSGQQRIHISSYLEGFQTIIAGSFILRILDVEGNSLVKVDLNHVIEPSFENFSGVLYTEQEILDENFIRQLKTLPEGEASVVQLPHNESQPTNGLSILLQDLVVPLYHDEQFVGAISLTMYGENIIRLISTTSRLYNGKLMVIEQDSEQPDQFGYLLYDEENLSRSDRDPFINPYSNKLLELASYTSEGQLKTEQGQQIYYTQMMPYPEKLIAWIIASEIDSNTLAEPFNRIRIGILSIATIALFFSIILMIFGAKRIANPLHELAKNIKEFAEGNHNKRLTTTQPIDEICTLANEFNNLANTLQEMEEERDRAQQMMLQNDKLVSIGEMAAGFGHEINNPLNNILSYSKLIQKALTQDNISEATLQQTRNDLSALRDESIRASEIVAGILNFARQVPLQYGQFNVCDWLEKTILLIQQSARVKMLNLEICCEYKGEIEGDQNQLQQVVINLLLNAIYVSNEHDTITIHCRKVDHLFEISIQDQGAGINPDQLNKIFDPFFTTKPEGVGTGLGLSISHGIIERHNGKLELNNRSHGGVDAKIQIPLNRGIV